MDSFKIKIPSLVENIRIVESFIENAKETCDINDDIYGNILIAITEAVNNAIKHGNQSNKSKFVTLTLEANEDQLRFTIKDQGDGFDPILLPDPTDPANLLKTSGRGVYLMRHLADEVSFTDSGRQVSLVFYIF